MRKGNVFITDSMPPFQNGGMETHAAEYIRYYGDRVIPYSFQPPIDEEERNAILQRYHLSHVHFTLPRESIWNPDILNAIIWQHNPEFVFFNSIYWMKVLEQVKKANTHVRFILRSGWNDISQSNVHDADTLEERRWFVVNAVNRGIDTLIVNSRYTQEEFEKYGIDANKMKVITGWVDIDRFHPVSNEEKEKIRMKLWLPSWKPIWVAISRLVPFKNIPAVLQVAKEITERTDSYFLIVGGGPMIDDVRRMIQELGIAHSVIFVWDIPAQDIAQYYQAWDYFLQMSTSITTAVQSTRKEWETYVHTETMGRSAMEAMATWLPIIATAVWWVPEVLQDSGILIPDNDVRRAVHAICDLVREPPEAKKIGERWRNIAVNKFSWGSVFNQYD